MQRWIVELTMRRYFDAKPGFRARTRYGALKDTIHQAVFEKDFKQRFTPAEIKAALKHEIIKIDQIIYNGEHRNIVVYVGEECQYQPTWYKRWLGKLAERIKMVRIFW